MAEATDTLGIIYQNLEDAGCNKQITQRCMSLVKTKTGGMAAHSSQLPKGTT